MTDESRDVSVRTGDDLGRMLRLRGGRVRFFGVTWRLLGFGIIRWSPPPTDAQVDAAIRSMTTQVRLRSRRPDVAWRWSKWTFGVWRDVANQTAFGIDVGPLEIVWRYEGYRP